MALLKADWRSLFCVKGLPTEVLTTLLPLFSATCHDIPTIIDRL